VIERRDNGAVIDVTARIPDRMLGHLKQRSGIRILDVA
jgi:hypothetical protein